MSIPVVTSRVQDAVASALGAEPSAIFDSMTSSVPSLRSVAKFALAGAQALLSSSSTAYGVGLGTSATCSNAQLSCHNTTVVENLCCFNAPGGQLLLTQFWDTAPATGPSHSWTIHGLWPDHCDGTYDANCDSGRAYINITRILQSFGKTDLLSYMEMYWKDYQGDDETFWQHEWGKHGTCISTLSPTCYTEYQSTQEVPDFFQKTVDLFKSLPSYEWLAAAGIVPSTSTTYTSAAIQAALTLPRGHPVTLGCKNGALNEIWYHFHVRGSVQSGDFVSADPDGSKSTCPSVGIKYLPKGSTVPGTTTLVTSTRTATTAPSGTSAPFSGRGFLNVVTGGSQKGCIISAGTWYTSGTCATFTAATSGSGFTLTSSKGECAISNGALTCGSSISTATVFTSVDGQLAADGISTFYAAAVPSGTTQQTVYTSSHPTQLEIRWQNI